MNHVKLSGVSVFLLVLEHIKKTYIYIYTQEQPGTRTAMDSPASRQTAMNVLGLEVLIMWDERNSEDV